MGQTLERSIDGGVGGGEDSGGAVEHTGDASFIRFRAVRFRRHAGCGAGRELCAESVPSVVVVHIHEHAPLTHYHTPTIGSGTSPQNSCPSNSTPLPRQPREPAQRRCSQGTGARDSEGGDAQTTRDESCEATTTKSKNNPVVSTAAVGSLGGRSELGMCRSWSDVADGEVGAAAERDTYGDGVLTWCSFAEKVVDNESRTSITSRGFTGLKFVPTSRHRGGTVIVKDTALKPTRT
ncbi:hypothetical protein DFP72DRAFT_847346 [Ephemerocybe angulata]|uniref:Uncharacterized protein n=1 Tax=Ephemerocybe angulata TaxID=980116 RepID=A0A8H6M4R6_9AGAR|nr:hypothetical protein DFP72DRAFT_847346 [Tulosesus angulatus]